MAAPHRVHRAKIMASQPRLSDEFAPIARYFAPLACYFPGAYGLVTMSRRLRQRPETSSRSRLTRSSAAHRLSARRSGRSGCKKALRVNLSGLAAKGAVSRAYLLNLILPEGIDEAWIAGFAAGLAADQAELAIAAALPRRRLRRVYWAGDAQRLFPHRSAACSATRYASLRSMPRIPALRSKR